MAIAYPSVADVMAFHIEMMESMGSNPSPLRGGGEALLESAIMKPQMAAYYEAADLIRQAALLAIGISQNQPYLDGNKRTAYIATLIFLRANGMPAPGEALLDMAEQLEAVATRTGTLEEATGRFEAWLRTAVAQP